MGRAIVTWPDYSVTLLALTLWREARGEPSEGRRAIAHVIRNRTVATHGDWVGVITKRWQFTSINGPQNDPNLTKWPQLGDAEFNDCMKIATDVYIGADVDPTGGAVNYANLSACDPEWAKTMRQTCVIGRHTFFAGNDKSA